MARSFNGSTDRIDYTSGLSFPFNSAHSISAWIVCDDITPPNGSSWFVAGHSASDTNFGNVFFIQNNEGAGQLQYSIIGGTSIAARTVSGVITQGALHHVCVTCPCDTGTNSTQVKIYVDGVEKSLTYFNPSTPTLDGTPSSISVGGRIYDDLRNFQGDISEVAFFTGILSAADIAMLANGVSAKDVRQDLHRFYAPLVRDANDIYNNVATFDGTTVSAHPRIFRQSSLFSGGFIDLSAGGGFRPIWTGKRSNILGAF